MSAAKDADQEVRRQVVRVLKNSGAHVGFEEAVEDWPARVRGVKPPGMAHTGWQLVEHMRIAQWDILEFCRTSKHVSPDFPSGYWPKTEAPPDEAAWKKSLAAFRADLEAMAALVESAATDLHERIAHGDGQTVLREALLVADHNAYHLGQLVLLRRALGSWESS
jgi:hypothetical protein